MSTADFVHYRDASLRADERIESIGRLIGEKNLSTVAANQIAEALLGNTIYANVLMLGYAWQKGLVPVSIEAISRAIELNGVEVDRNKDAFSWGRIAAGNPDTIKALLETPHPLAAQDETLDQIVQRRAEFLIDYQNHALAEKYHQLVNRVRTAEEQYALSGNSSLTNAVARAYFKLLAYKDEYEVARLHTATGFLEKIKRDYGNKARVNFHLAPPLLQTSMDARGRPRKRQFGPWMILAFRILAKLRGLRGTPFDLLGLSGERKLERALIGEFEELVEQILSALRAENLSDASEIVSLIMDIRGYGPVKEQAARKIRGEISDRLRNFMQIRKEAA
jgi:indolepyruvate ferredoxin oxidoreductase